jgi:hypothetical protein
METNPYALTSAQKTLRAARAQETGPAGHLPFFTFSRPILVVLGRNNPSLYTVKGRPLYVHLNGLAIVLLK